MLSLVKAVAAQKQMLYDSVMGSEGFEDRLRDVTDDVKRHLSDLQEQADKQRKEISAIYN